MRNPFKRKRKSLCQCGECYSCQKRLVQVYALGIVIADIFTRNTDKKGGSL